MQAKLAYLWKQKRRGRLSFLGAQIVWSVLFSIADLLIEQIYIRLYPEDTSSIIENAFYYSFSFTLYGVMETALVMIQIYVFTLILSQRVRDIGIKYPVIISLIFTASPIVLIPYFLFNAPTMMMVFSFILLLGGLVALLAPSAYKVDIDTNNSDKYDRIIK